jgi:hypothetical protein
MSAMDENIVTLYPQVTRAGLNALLSLPDGIDDAITHIGLGTAKYTPTAEQTAARGEVLRVPVLDAMAVGDNAIMFAAVASGWTGELTAIYEILFYLSDGTLLAAYSSNEAEAVLKKGRSEELFYTLTMDVIPADKLQVVSTQTYFQPGVRESILMLMTDALANKIDDMSRDERIGRGETTLLSVKSELLQAIATVSRNSKTALDDQAKQFLQLLAWEQHTQAMYRRARGHSGLMAIRQYTYHGDLRGTASSEKGTPGHMHQHPEWGDLVGTGEVWGVINGWTFKARHRDHHMERPADVGSAWLATEKLLPPPLPPAITSETTVAGQTAAMVELFRRYNAGEFPVGFRADLTALEVWFEPYSSTIGDTFHSQRHALQTNSMTDALRLMMHYAHSGLKDRFENQSVEMPLVAWVDAAGNPQLGIMRYRMVCTSLASIGDVRPALAAVDDFSFDEGGWGRSSQRYRVKENANSPCLLDQMMGLLPGLDGAGATLTETHTRYGQSESIRTWADGNSPLNAAYYNRFAQALGDDAANRHHFIRGDYDPHFFVASNTRDEVLPMAMGGNVYRWSWAIPMEIVIRTPLESWNPYNVPTVADSGNYSNAGTQANPIRGLNPSVGAYFMTPAELYSGASNAEAADTATDEYWVMCGDGTARKMRASGIWMQTPPIIGVGSAKTRFAIHPEHQEGDKPYAFAMGAYRQTAGVSMYLMQQLLSAKIERMDDSIAQSHDFAQQNAQIVALSSQAHRHRELATLDLLSNDANSDGLMYRGELLNPPELGFVSVPSDIAIQALDGAIEMLPDGTMRSGNGSITFTASGSVSSLNLPVTYQWAINGAVHEANVLSLSWPSGQPRPKPFVWAVDAAGNRSPIIQL